MSEVDPGPVIPQGPEVLQARKAQIGDGTQVRRLLPHRAVRTVGAWCFLDHYGPDDISASAGMQVPPHPHTGLQTATWLFEGVVLHRDSLGSEQVIRPGELNLMTSGRGISHSEESPAEDTGRLSARPAARPALLHGIQLWIALPRARQFTEPAFEHHAELPVVGAGAGRSGEGLPGPAGARVTVVAGEFAGQRSPAVVHTPLVGLEVALPDGGSVTLPAREDFEYGVMAADGPATVWASTVSASTAPGGGRSPGPYGIEPGSVAYVPAGASSLELSAGGPGRLFVVGGVPLGERLVMWWNFVARTHEEIAAARESWMAGDGRFGQVRGYQGDPLPAPPLPPGTLIPR
jgi:redox-sensitive bicupin YhaK (pirin superfamily)